MTAILSHFPNGVPDRANFYFYGLTKGWVLSQVIGLADADEVDEMLPPRPDGAVIEAILYGPEDVNDPEFASLTEEDIPEGLWFSCWRGMKKSLYFLRQNGSEMPERSALAWLGFLLGELEGGGIATAEYDKRAPLAPVTDDLTPLVVASSGSNSRQRV